MNISSPVDAAPIADCAAEPVLFDATLHPHRSLGPAGFAVLMGLVAAVGFGTGVVFLVAGAWPVFGFCGLEVLLIYVCFRLNYRSAGLFERVRLTGAALTVERRDWRGRARLWTFQPYWLRVAMDDPPLHDSRLTLSSHGRSLAIGSFLAPEERAELARALRHALWTARAAG